MITAVVITSRLPLNKSFLESLSFASRTIIVVDSAVKVTIPETKGVKYYFRPLNNDFAGQRNFALEKANTEWVLFVDDDEYVSKELASEIISTILNTDMVGFRLHRLDVVYHQPLLYGETGGTKILRLGKRASGKFVRPVHEIWKLQGRVGEIGTPLYHIKDHFISEYFGRMINYGQIDAKQLNKESKPFSIFRLLLNPTGKFVQNYFLRKGFLDGYPGLFLSYLMSIQSLTIRVFQWEKRN